VLDEPNFVVFPLKNHPAGFLPSQSAVYSEYPTCIEVGDVLNTADTVSETVLLGMAAKIWNAQVPPAVPVTFP
jgi:hypothetical protein